MEAGSRLCAAGVPRPSRLLLLLLLLLLQAVPNLLTKAIAETSSYQEKLYYFQTQAEIPADIRVPDQGSPPLEAVHQCQGSTYAHRVCKYQNLLLWNDTFYYPTTDPSALAGNIPTVPLSWVELPDFQQLRLGINDSLQVVHPSSLPFDWESVPKLELQHAVLWFLTFQDNHGHLLGEHGPTLHTLLCTYLGRCGSSSRDVGDLHILLAHNQASMLAQVPVASLQMFSCFSKHPMRQTNDTLFKGRAVVVRNMLAGIGPTCRGYPYCRPRYGRSGPVPAMMSSWRERLLTCLNLPTSVRASKQPSIMLVNRPFHQARGFLNAPKILTAMQARYGLNASVAVREVAGPSLKEQALLYLNASILIQMHGAALGNMIFLPRGACVVDIVPQNNDDKHAWAFFMAADLKAHGCNPIAVPPQRTHLMLHRVQQSPQWHMLSTAWQEKIAEEGICPERQDVGFRFDAYEACNFQWFLKNSNVMLDGQQLMAAVDHAILHLSVHADDSYAYVKSRRFNVLDW